MGKQILIQKILGANGDENVKSNAFASCMALALPSSLPYSLYIEKKQSTVYFNTRFQNGHSTSLLGRGGRREFDCCLESEVEQFKSVMEPFDEPLVRSKRNHILWPGVFFYGRYQQQGRQNVDDVSYSHPTIILLKLFLSLLWEWCVSTRKCNVSIRFCLIEGIKKDPIFRNSNAAGVSN